MSQHPESTHWTDVERFYDFVHTIHRYRSEKKWLDYNYFRDRILALKPKFDEDRLQYLHEELAKLLRFKKRSAIPTHGLDPYDKRGYVERGVEDGEIYEREISKGDY